MANGTPPTPLNAATVHHLSPGVHTGVGATRAGDRDPLGTQDHAERRLKFSLDRA